MTNQTEHTLAFFSLSVCRLSRGSPAAILLIGVLGLGLVTIVTSIYFIQPLYFHLHPHTSISFKHIYKQSTPVFFSLSPFCLVLSMLTMLLFCFFFKMIKLLWKKY